MGNCTVCPFVRYWYIVAAILVVLWAVGKFMRSRGGENHTPVAGVEELTSANFTAKTASGIVLVDFRASWCGPCKRQTEVIAETVPDLPGGTVIAAVDIDDSRDLAEQFNIKSVPTWIVFRDGHEIIRKNGLLSREELLNLAQGDPIP